MNNHCLTVVEPSLPKISIIVGWPAAVCRNKRILCTMPRKESQSQNRTAAKPELRGARPRKMEAERMERKGHLGIEDKHQTVSSSRRSACSADRSDGTGHLCSTGELCPDAGAPAAREPPAKAASGPGRRFNTPKHIGLFDFKADVP